MPIIKTTLLLLLASLSFTSKAQYNEAMCILLKQQMHEYRNNTSNKNYRSAARNYEKNCQNPTPLNNGSNLKVQQQPTQPVEPVIQSNSTRSTQHSGAIQGTPEEPTQPTVEQASEIIEPQQPAEQLQIEPEPLETQNTQLTPPVQQTEEPADVDRIIISDTPTETVAEPVTSPVMEQQLDNPAPDSSQNSETTDVRKAVEAEPVEPAFTPEPAAPYESENSSSSSLLMPSLIVLLVLLIAGLVIVRIRQNKNTDADSELEQSLMQAKALKAAAQAQASAEKEAEELQAATAAVLNENSEQSQQDTDSLPDFTNELTEKNDNDDLAELMHFSAQHDSEKPQTPSTQTADDFADAKQFNDLELGYDDKDVNDSDDDFLDEQRGLEQELKLASLASSYSINEETTPKAEESKQDESELEEPRDSASSSFGFDEYTTKEPIAEDEPVLTEIEALEKPEIDELEKPEIDEPSFTSSSSFGFDEYSTKEPIADDEPVLTEIEAIEKPEIDELEKPEFDEPSFTSSSSFGFDEYKAKEPIADDEPVLTEIEELEKPEIDELEKPEFDEPSFTSSSSFGFDEYSTKEPIADDEPSRDDVPEYDLSSLMGDDLSFADHFAEDKQTVTAPSTTDDHDDISDDDLAKALQALEQELQDEPASFSPEEPTKPAEDTVDLSVELSNDDMLEQMASDSDEADKETNLETEQQDDKPYNPFANLSLDPTWDPNSDEKPVIKSKTKQPKSQALIDAEERAKQLKTDE
ncbi:hypothetical protein L1266_15310 [Pseudoalteromonas sp. Cn5-37]|uniref:hypothetical protein n=1 Tax=Pseudoalteromonas sp. Cn5-37 TaxID=2908886 RepID=UPI001F25F3AE|nr:hypothetical protein [Pseudoalteromonas sp. Cn5-37]MCF2917549.1 hypothetical protein [Pseudoalteromonas sp. Cn5-37]